MDATVFDMVEDVGYVVATPVFEGPIDLLLHLVGTHEVDILDLPLAPVVDAFVAHLTEHRQELEMDVLSEFLLVAAILVELKSQRLLPGPDEVEDDDELVGWEERDLLLSRLLECRAYAAAADTFVVMTELAARSVPREVGLDEGFVVHAPDLLAGVTPDKLAQAYLRATAEQPVPEVDLSHVTVDAVTVSETVAVLTEILPERGRTTFRQLTGHLTERIDVIVHFLAVLELCKQGRVTLEQGTTFGDLQVVWITDSRLLAAVSVGVDEYDG
jgi:segregation and condensation protein A